MEFTKVHTDKAPAALGPYSQAVVAGGMVFLSGQGGINPETGKLVEGGVTEEAKQIMKNIGAVLEAAGASFENVVKTTVFLADMGDFAAFNEIYAEYFTTKPARSCVAAKTLPAGFSVEVEVIAVK